MPSLVFLLLALCLLTMLRVVLHSIGVDAGYPGEQLFTQNPWIDGLCRWDSSWYRGIARQGYWYVEGQQSPVAYFPGYPMVIRAVAAVTGLRELRVGVLVTLGSGLAATVLFHRWSAQRLERRALLWAVLSLLMSPFSFFLFGVVYADALFLVLVLASFSLLESDRPHVAGLVAALATATRPVGIALALGLVVRTLERRGCLIPGMSMRERLRQVQRRDVAVLLAPLGLVFYSLFLWRSFGDPFAFATVQEAWGQQATPGTWLKEEFFWQFRSVPWTRFHLALTTHMSLGLGGLLLARAVARRFGWGYAVYFVVVLGAPLLASKDFMGVGRYLLAAFPAFALAGEWLVDRPVLRWAVPAASVALQFYFAAQFGLGHYVS